MTAARSALSRATLASRVLPAALARPSAAELAAPERVIQFGTGAFLRGFVDAFIHDANLRGDFNGRVVMVGSTGSGRDARLNDQDGLYTLVVQGLVEGMPRRELHLVGSVSRALSAVREWNAVLACAESPDMMLVVSNTTEVGIVLHEGDAADGASASAPASFPGKLARWLHHRARHFAFDAATAPIVLPCELIESNGDRLRDVIVALASRWELEPRFVQWLGHVTFCNTLVDRIVQGAPGAAQREVLSEEVGYEDAMMTACEPYRLFAIQGDDTLRKRLRFPGADASVIVTGDIAPYRERKVRLLNGAHTALVPLALLAGCTTVRDAVDHPALGAFLRSVLLDEVVPSVNVPGAETFAGEVMDRFANPWLEHQLWDITLQGATKMRVRVVPTILDYARLRGEAPRALALGFAGYLALQRGELQAARVAAGRAVPADDAGDVVRQAWNGVSDNAADLERFVASTCANVALWGTDLTVVPEFTALVVEALGRIRRDGAVSAITATLGAAA